LGHIFIRRTLQIFHPTPSMERQQFATCEPIKLLDTASPEEMLKEACDAEDAENSIEGKPALTPFRSF